MTIVTYIRHPDDDETGLSAAEIAHGIAHSLIEVRYVPAIRNPRAPCLDGQHARSQGPRMAQSQAVAAGSAGVVGRHAANADGGNAQ